MAKLNLDATFAALADPTRRAILARLSRGETAVMELAKPFDMSLPAISKHLKVLERAGLISRSREAQSRPCRIEAQPLRDVDAWLDHYRRFFEESLDRLDAYLKKLQAAQRDGMSESKRDTKKDSKHGRSRQARSRKRSTLDHRRP
jgi:DNA-binding transcriptional ArsR family regulator